MLDILVYLYESFRMAELAPDRDALEKRLFAAGFEESDINAALDWYANLTGSATHERLAHAHTTVITRAEELERLNEACRSELAYLVSARNSRPGIARMGHFRADGAGRRGHRARPCALDDADRAVEPRVDRTFHPSGRHVVESRAGTSTLISHVQTRHCRIAVQIQDAEEIPGRRLRNPRQLRPRARPGAENRRGRHRKFQHEIPGHRAQRQARRSHRQGRQESRRSAAGNRPGQGRRGDFLAHQRNPQGAQGQDADEARGLLRDHRIRHPGRGAPPARDRDRPGRRAAGAARAGLSGRLQPVAAAVEQDQPRLERRPRAVACLAHDRRARGRDRGLRPTRILDAASRYAQRCAGLHRQAHPLQGRETRAVHGRARSAQQGMAGDAGRQGCARDAHREEAPLAQPWRAIHHLDPAAGRRAPARHDHRPRHAHRAAAVRRHRPRRRPGRPHHLHAYRLGEPGAGSDHRYPQVCGH